VAAHALTTLAAAAALVGHRRVRDARAPFVRTLRGDGRVRAVARLRDRRRVRP
jgi:hypothetical protein